MKARRLRVKAVIAGCPVVFYSDKADAVAPGDGRIAVGGLLLEGLALEADADPVRGELDIREVRLRVVDARDGSLRTRLGVLPSVVTYVAQDASDTDATIYVQSNSGVSVGDYVHIGVEVCKVVGVGTDALGDYLDVDRAQWDTAAASYYAPTDREPSRSVAVTDAPDSYAGRRVELYVHDGTTWQLEWRGVAMDSWRYADGHWELTVAGLSEALEAAFAPADELGQQVTGYAAPDAAWGSALGNPKLPMPLLDVGLLSSPVEMRSPVDLVAGTVWRFRVGGSTVYDVRLYGEYSDISAYAAALEAELNAAHGLADHRFRVVGRDDGSLSISWEIDSGATPQSVELATPWQADWSVLYDGMEPATTLIDGRTYDLHAGRERFPFDGYPWDRPGWWGRVVGVFSLPATGSGLSPEESTLGLNGLVKHEPPTISSDRYITYRGPAMLLRPRGSDDLDIELRTDYEATFWATPVAGGFKITQLVSAPDIDSTDGVRLVLFSGLRMPGSDATVRVSAYASGDHLGDVLADMVAQRAAHASLGRAPVLYADDFESLTDAQADLNRADSDSPLFSWARTPVVDGDSTLREWLSGELAARAVMFGCDPAGRFRFRKVRTITEGATTLLDMDESVVVTDDGWPVSERDAWGRFTRADWRDGFDFSTRKHMVQMTVVDYRAAAVTAKERAIKVELRSTPKPPIRPRAAAWRWGIIESAHRLLSLWGQPYMLVEVTTGWSVRAGIGDLVRLRFKGALDPETGARTLDRIGVVVGFRRDLDRATCHYRVLVWGRRAYGYAPTTRVKTAVSLGGNKWELTLDTVAHDSLEMLNEDRDIAAMYPVGAKVRLRASGGTSYVTATVTATITGTSGDIVVTTDTTWTPGGSDWYVVYQPASAVIAEQEPWAYVADATTGSIGFATPTDARRYAP